MSNDGPSAAVPPAISTRPSFNSAAAWPERATCKAAAGRPGAGRRIVVATPLESAPPIVPPATSTRPSGSATDAAPLGIAPTSPAGTHVPLATCGTSARTTSHDDAASTVTASSAATDLIRRADRLTFEREMFISSPYVKRCLERADHPASFVRRAGNADRFRHFRDPPTQPTSPLLVREPVSASFATCGARVSTPRAANVVS